jgi:hypothetical protein
MRLFQNFSFGTATFFISLLRAGDAGGLIVLAAIEFNVSSV